MKARLPLLSSVSLLVLVAFSPHVAAAAAADNGENGTHGGVAPNLRATAGGTASGTERRYASHHDYLGVVNESSRRLELLDDWVFCTSSAECSNGCCSDVYSISDGKLKCTPIGGFDPSICVTSDSPSSGPPPASPTSASAPAPGTGGSLGDWDFCNSSTECSNGCCSDVYSISDGKLKCTPIGGFDPNICVTSDSPSSGPPVPPVPTTTPGKALYIGYYEWTWTWGVDGQSPVNHPDENFSIAFSGWADAKSALTDSETVYTSLRGEKFICIGGGNENGRWTASAISSLDSYINAGSFGHYAGIVYDIEEGDSGLAQAFADSFARAKSRGLKVIVTVSHSAPYGVEDSYTLMQSFFSNTNIDAISPQLYTSGNEGSNDYSESGGVSWSDYKNSRPAIVPSLVSGGSYYNDAQTVFENQHSIRIQGYIKWSQT